MTGVWEVLPTKPPPKSLQLVETICDRCGGEATIRGAGDARAWGQVEVYVQGESGPHHADLCMDCAEWLRGQINSAAHLHGAAGMQDHVTHVNEPGRHL